MHTQERAYTAQLAHRDTQTKDHGYAHGEASLPATPTGLEGQGPVRVATCWTRAGCSGAGRTHRQETPVHPQGGERPKWTVHWSQRRNVGTQQRARGHCLSNRWFSRGAEDGPSASGTLGGGPTTEPRGLRICILRIVRSLAWELGSRWSPGPSTWHRGDPRYHPLPSLSRLPDGKGIRGAMGVDSGGRSGGPPAWLGAEGRPGWRESCLKVTSLP